VRIYVAGPYRLGDVKANGRRAMDAGTALLARSHAPLVPHLNHFCHRQTPHPERTWIDFDLVWLEVADAVLRLPGASEGADEECDYAGLLGIPVFCTLDAIPVRAAP